MKTTRREENQAILNQAMQMAMERGSLADAMQCVLEAASRLGLEDIDQRRVHMLSEVMTSRLRKH